ncbi:MAG: Dabb family protein [Bacteroidota bacterium]
MRIPPLVLMVLFLSTCNQARVTELETENEIIQEQLAAALTELTSLQQAGNYQPGLIHSVFFWLKEDLLEEDRTAFLAGVESLREVTSVKQMYVGPVAPTEARGVVDNTYSTALLVHFDDVAGQDAYQIDPIHLKFVEDHKDKWTKVVVYDNLVE